MRLICVPSLFFLISLIAHITHAVEFIETNSLQQQQYQQSVSDESNIDDTSLFRGVENAIDEDAEDDDAYRILKSLQDVSEDDFSDEDDEDVNEIEHSSSRAIKSRIQPEEEDDDLNAEEEEDQGDDEEEEDDDEEEEEEEEDDEEDFSLGPFPDFKNEETTDFFEHLSQNPSNTEDEKDVKEQEEEDIEEDNIENHIDIHDVEEEDYDEEEDTTPVSNNNNNNINNNHNPIPVVLSPSLPVSPPSIDENSIPWHRPDSKDRLIVNDVDNKFNQDSNYNSSFQHKEKSTAGFRFWHGVFVFSILVIIFKSSNRKKAHHLLDSNNTSSLWSKDEKDYLPLHISKGNRNYSKWEIKSS